MTRRSFQPSVSTAGVSVCSHFNFRTVLYLQLLAHVFRITYCPGATVLSSADTSVPQLYQTGYVVPSVTIWTSFCCGNIDVSIVTQTIFGSQLCQVSQVSRPTLLFIGRSCLHTVCKRMHMNGVPSVLFGNYASRGLRAQLCVRVASLDGRQECHLQRAVKPPGW
jgi:hypothetical protein